MFCNAISSLDLVVTDQTTGQYNKTILSAQWP